MALSNMSERVGVATCMQRYITTKQIISRPLPLLVQHCTRHQLDLLVHRSWSAVPYLEKSMDPALTECWLWVSQSAVRATKLKEVAEAFHRNYQEGCRPLVDSGQGHPTLAHFALRWWQSWRMIVKKPSKSPAGRAQGIQTIIMSFMFVCTLYILVMSCPN
jgi:hypothetical protein